MQRIFFALPTYCKGLALKQQLCFFSAASSTAFLFLDAFRRSLLLLVAVVFTVVSLSVICCRLLRPFIRSLLLLLPSHAIQSFTLPSFRRCRLLSRFVVLSLASHSFTSVSHRHHHWPATCQLQHLMVNVDSLLPKSQAGEL